MGSNELVKRQDDSGPQSSESIREDQEKFRHHARINLDSATPRRATEVVSDGEERARDGFEHRARTPRATFATSPYLSEALVPGAEVRTETLIGFLAAIEEMSRPSEASAGETKVTFRPGDAPKLYLEAHNHNVWAVSVVEAKGKTDQLFSVIVPVRRTINVLKSISDRYENIVVGVGHDGLCLGPNVVPVAASLDDFPPEPVIQEPEVLAAIPDFYFKEIRDRVIPARSHNQATPALHGVLLSFELVEFGDEQRPVAHAVCSDGFRIHVLKMPQIMLDNHEVSTPSVVLPEGFFRYVHAVANRRWVGIEFGESQVMARGHDFAVVARATMAGSSSNHRLSRWHQSDVDYDGYWVVDADELRRVISAAHDGESFLSIRLETSPMERDAIYATAVFADGTVAKDVLPGKNQGAPDWFSVKLNAGFLLDAVEATHSGLIRLGWQSEDSPVVVKGEGEQFKALLMPIIMDIEE